MDDGARSMMRECRIEVSGVEDVALLERAPADELGVPFRQIVECDRQEALRGQRLAGVTADEAGAAGHENGLHRVHGTTRTIDPVVWRASRSAWARGASCSG